VTAALRVSAVLLLVRTLGFGQTSAPVVEPPAQAHKLLQFAAQLDADAKRARLAGRQHATEPAHTPPAKLHFPTPATSGEQLINDRSNSSNGIYVDVPKVYDDALLQQMLGSAQSHLASLQGFDQSGLSKAIGSVTGANQQIASFGITGGVQPPVIQTSYGNITSPFAPPPANAPAPTTTLPSNPTPSASDILNEQLQITSEIANLRLLLEGSLSDQIMVAQTGHQETFTKPRVTLGFPVVISPEQRYRNSVAIVEVLVETNSTNDASREGEPPSITALLPQEKTYNIAAISDKSASIGLGIATATAGAAGSFLWGHKQYFIVKDQDTLASQFQPTDPEINLISSQQPLDPPINKRRLRAFAWQFRPVLGQPFVQAGVRQVFVQLAFPGPGIAPAVKSFGSVRIRTYWRRVDPKTGVLLWIVPGSLSEVSRPRPIANYDLHQKWGAVAAFNSTDLEDLGSGKMLVKLNGQLLPGSYLRIGSNIVQPGSAGAPSDLKTTRFVASISDLATLNTFVVSRDGTEYPLKIEPGGINQFRVDQQHVTVTPIDDTNILLRVPITNFITTEDTPPILLIGGKVFGYSDAPIDRDCNPAAGRCVLSVALPKDFLAANPVVSVKMLMLDENGLNQSNAAVSRTFTIYPQSLAQEKVILLSHDSDFATYLLYSHDLKQATLLWPQCPATQVCLQPVNPAADDGTERMLRLPVALVKDPSSILLQRADSSDHPVLIAIPALPADASAAPDASSKSTAPKFQERVVVGGDEGTIVGDKLDSIVSANFGGKPLNIVQKTPSALKINGLGASGASAVAKTQEVVLVNQAGNQIKVPLEVVSSRVEVVSK
jgi:hypothetical protein